MVFWSQGINNIPDNIKIYLKNWNKHLSNKKYKINIIDDNIFMKNNKVISKDLYNFLTHQQKSDIVRLYYLYYYGGIWIDISTILRSNLDWIINKFNKGYEMICFNIKFPFVPKSKYLLENWFIAVKNPRYYIIEKWKDTFLKILKDYKLYGSISKSKIWINTDKKYIFMYKEYLSMHVANLWCVQNDKKYKELLDNEVYIYNANSTALVSPQILPIRFIIGMGYNHNFNIVKLNKPSRKLIPYFCSIKLKKIINDELPGYKIESLLFLKILFIIIIIFIILYFIFKIFLKK